MAAERVELEAEPVSLEVRGADVSVVLRLAPAPDELWSGWFRDHSQQVVEEGRPESAPDLHDDRVSFTCARDALAFYIVLLRDYVTSVNEQYPAAVTQAARRKAEEDELRALIREHLERAG